MWYYMFTFIGNCQTVFQTVPIYIPTSKVTPYPYQCLIFIVITFNHLGWKYSAPVCGFYICLSAFGFSVHIFGTNNSTFGAFS